MTAFRPAFLSILLALSVAACGDQSVRYLLDAPAAQERVSLRVRTIEVRDVTLPDYASGSGIMIQGEDGALRPAAKAVWADDPVRAVTLSLARDLEAVSTARAAAEPWPLFDPAQVRLEVRIDRMVAQDEGTFRLAGQFSIAAPQGVVRESLNRFDISQPLSAQTPSAVAEATSAAILSLAGQIAARLR